MPQSRSERIAGICIYIILSLISLVVLYPLYFVLIASISAPETVMRGEVWLWPKELSFVVFLSTLPSASFA